jgi:alpha-L-fucosidase 2
MQGLPLPNVTCFDSSTLRIRGFVAQPGMLYELLLRASSSGGKVSCAPTAVMSTATPIGGAGTNATLTVQGAKNVWLSWVGGTEYNMNAGDAAHGFSFRGVDPHAGLVTLLSALPKSYSSERAAHVKDVNAVLGKFSLDLGTPSQEALNTPTDELVASYEVDTGNVYLEWVTFNYGRYMLFSSARGALPANLQGKWAFDSGAPWSAGMFLLLLGLYICEY